jgi:hypothetical protein
LTPPSSHQDRGAVGQIIRAEGESHHSGLAQATRAAYLIFSPIVMLLVGVYGPEGCDSMSRTTGVCAVGVELEFVPRILIVMLLVGVYGPLGDDSMSRTTGV